VFICLERGADLHMVQQIPLPLTVSCFSKMQIGFTFLVLAHLGSPGERAIKRVCVCVWLLDVSPTGHFPDRSFPWQDDSPTGLFPNTMFNELTRQGLA